jgi:ribose-phosphate pyrophosphokinase
MIDTAGSVAAAAEALKKEGAAKDIYLVATHPIFSGPAPKRLAKAGFKEVVVSDTMPLTKQKQFKGLKQISIAPLLANVIASITHQKSVSKLFF